MFINATIAPKPIDYQPKFSFSNEIKIPQSKHCERISRLASVEENEKIPFALLSRLSASTETTQILLFIRELSINSLLLFVLGIFPPLFHVSH